MWPRITRPEFWQGCITNTTRPPAALPGLASNPSPRIVLTDKSTDHHRTIVVTFRLSAAEHADVVLAAQRVNLPPSVYVRHAALAKPLVVKSYDTLAPEDVAQIKRIGNLLNQIARALWRGRCIPATEDHLNAVLAELRRVLATALRREVGR